MGLLKDIPEIIINNPDLIANKRIIYYYRVFNSENELLIYSFIRIINYVDVINYIMETMPDAAEVYVWNYLNRINKHNKVRYEL